MYFSGDMIGKDLNFICKVLPFSSSLDILKGILNSNYTDMKLNVLVYLIYTIITAFITILIFKKQMETDNK